MKKTIILLFMCLSLIFVNTVSAFDGLNNVEIHGFISQGYLQSNEYDYLEINTDDGSFEFNEMGINFSTTPVDGLRLGAQFFSRDFGEIGNDGLELDWAYGDYRVNNYLGVRAGKVKIALGLYNEVRDVDAVRTSIMLPNAIYVEQNRDIYSGIKGVGIYGELPGGFTYQATYGVGPVAEDSNLLNDLTLVLNNRLQIGYRDSYLAIYKETVKNIYLSQGASEAVADQAGTLAASTEPALSEAVAFGSSVSFEVPTSVEAHNTQNAYLQWTPKFVEGLRLCGTWLYTEIDMRMRVTTPVSATSTITVEEQLNIEHLSSTVVSIEYIFGETVLAAEYNIIRIDIGQFQGMDVPTNKVHGWALSASHRFAYWFELGAYYSDWNTNIDDKDGKDFDNYIGNRLRAERWMRDACITTRFDLNESWILKIEGHYMNGLDGVEYQTNPDPDPDWFLFAGKISYNF
ncbi:MAG: hypothetical protein ABIK15_13055 [Pseudomonadota bacterium]